MSLIRFRTKVILPPVVTNKADVNANDKDNPDILVQEEQILSASPKKALCYMLPGFKEDPNANDISINTNFIKNKDNTPKSMSYNTDTLRGNSPRANITPTAMLNQNNNVMESSKRETNLSKNEHCSKSTSFLYNYLELLTSGDSYNLYGSLQKKSEDNSSQEDAHSSESFEIKTVRKRSSSVSSDKSQRSLGSTFLDSYLGNLTDSSWIEYPKEGNPFNTSFHEDDKSKSLISLATLEQGKLHFIKPEGFYKTTRQSNSPHLKPVSSTKSNVEPNQMTVTNIENDDSMFDESFKSFIDSDAEKTIENTRPITNENVAEASPECSISSGIEMTCKDSDAPIEDENNSTNDVTLKSPEPMNDSVDNFHTPQVKYEPVTPKCSREPINQNAQEENSSETYMKLLNFLKAKHLKELSALQAAQERELDLLEETYAKLNELKLKELEGCLKQVDSMENLMDILHDIANDADEMSESSIRSSHSLPSFYLHDNSNSETNSAELANSDRISKLFSPTQSVVQHINEPIRQEPEDYRIRDFYRKENSVSCMLSPITEMSTSEVLEAQLCYYKQFDSGLDLVPAREKDNFLADGTEITPAIHLGIAKLQAFIRGRRTRRMLLTNKVKQQITILHEVSKLAEQFHHDIMTDNITKGDITFHKSLYNQEIQARNKVHHLMVELTPLEQLQIIHIDEENKLKSHHKLVNQPTKTRQAKPICRSSSMPIPVTEKSQVSKQSFKSKMKPPQKVDVSHIGPKVVTRLAPENQRPKGKPQPAPRTYLGPPKRQPLSPRKNVSSNVNVQKAIKVWNSARENNSVLRKPSIPLCKMNAKVSDKCTGIVTIKAQPKNVPTTKKPWR